jgi:hypothetical protein
VPWVLKASNEKNKQDIQCRGHTARGIFRGGRGGGGIDHNLQENPFLAQGLGDRKKEILTANVFWVTFCYFRFFSCLISNFIRNILFVGTCKQFCSLFSSLFCELRKYP